MSSEGLAERTRQHYETLIGEVGDDYINLRWRQNRVQRSHYRHTRFAVSHFFADRVGRVEHVIEVGCGPGTWTDICLEHAARVTLVDISKEMLDLVRARYQSLDRVAFVQSDFGGEMSRIDAQADVVFCARAFEYMVDKPRALDNARECLRPGGVLAIITKNPEWFDKRQLAKRGSGKRGPDDIQTDWMHWKQLKHLVATAGFERAEVYPVAIGSYERPFRSMLGVAVSDLVHLMIRGRRMRSLWDRLTESYLLVARRQ